LLLNVAKCEVAVFSNSSHDASWRPQICLAGCVMPFNPSPTFLGIKLDRALTFRPQAESIAKRMNSRCRILACLAGRDWGWRAHHLRRVYQAMSLSILKYCGPAWQPWLSNTSLSLLQRAQNRALRLITGQVLSTPVEALHLEANISSVQSTSRQDALIGWERTLRLPPNNPRVDIARSELPHRSH
jgi:hypothetical protein